MPASKRARVVSLTKTDKKGRDQKNLLVERIRQIVPNYETIYVFRVSNMRNVLIKDLRKDWNDSVFLFGRNKVIQYALGPTPESEIADNVCHLAKVIEGDCGLLFTNRSHEEVVNFFENFEVPEYARAGFIPTEEFVIPEGPLENFSHTQEPFLRSLGLPTEMKNGVVHCRCPFTVSSPGVALTPEKANLLKQFGVKLASFKVHIFAKWSKGEFLRFDE
ncbi:hypothetical protein P9112_013328 [Eukaryota sp. TZLM1-RC]